MSGRVNRGIALPNKRLKLAAALRLKESAGSCPSWDRTSSATHFEAVHAALVRQHFEVAVEQGSGQVSQFMRVTISGHSEEVIGRAMTLFEVVADTLGWGTSPTFTVRFGGPLDVPRIRAQLAAARGRGA